MVSSNDVSRWAGLLETQRLFRHEIGRAVPDLSCAQDDIDALLRDVGSAEGRMERILSKITQRVEVLK